MTFPIPITCPVVPSPGSRLTCDTALPAEEADEQSAPEFVARPADTQALQGNNVTLDCAANGQPRPHVTWLKDGTDIDMS